MAVWGFYTDSLGGWSNNKLASLTDDFIFPAANVYATTNLTGIAVMNNSFVFAGILEYRTTNPKTGKHTVVSVGTLNASLSLANAVIDENVDRVTFGLGIWDTGGGDFNTAVNSVNQVWLFE